MYSRTSIGFLFLLLSATISWSAEIRLSWEVVQPFRFYRFFSDARIHEWAYADAVTASGGSTENIVSKMESRLNSTAWWTGPSEIAGMTRLERFRQLRREELNELKRPYIEFDPRLGWASILRNEERGSPAGGTCWDPDRKTYKGCVSDIGQIGAVNNDDYVMPKRHMVQLRIEEKTSSGWRPYAGACHYAIKTTAEARYGFVPTPLYRGPESWAISSPTCESPLFLRTRFGTSYPIEVTFPAAPEQPLTEEISVADLLVVGIGDSFASGEGNPELPAVLDKRRGTSPYVRLSSTSDNVPDGQSIIPTRERNSDYITSNSRAHWLDDQCHRSIYSAQARAAIALSLEGQRHHAITFVSYACSGAEITDGLFWPQDHRECADKSPARERLHQPQISGVIEALSASAARYSQFSLGLESEDLYYKRYIKRMEVLGPTAGLPALRKAHYTCASWPGRSEIRRNAVLRTAGLNRPIDLLLVSIGGNDIGFGPLVSKAVINSGVASASLPIITERAIRKYQQEAGAITLDEANARMGSLDRRFLMLNTAITKKFEMSTPSRVVVTAYPRLTKTQNGFCGPGNRGMNVSTFFATVEGEGPNRVTPRSADGIVGSLNGKIRSITERYGWSYVDDHVSKFVGHSFCDSDSGVTSTNRFIESMDIPHRGRAAPNSPWLAFEPTKDFYPYESRKRWVRTFNDAYLLSFYFKGATAGAPAVDDDIGIYQAQRALGGPMHPSAEGHAHMADAIVERARKLLFIDGLAVPLGE